MLALSFAAKAPPPPSRFLAVDAQRHRVTITLIASYDGTNGGFNFDGYSRYLMWTVPRGWDPAPRIRGKPEEVVDLMVSQRQAPTGELTIVQEVPFKRGGRRSKPWPATGHGRHTINILFSQLP